MIRLVKPVYLGAALLLAVATAAGQKVTFEAHAPGVVAAGEVFRIEYSVNAQAEKFTPLASFSGFDVLAGPTSSFGQSISVSGGNVIKTVNYSYTYVLRGNEEGKFSIPAAEITVDGNTYQSKPLPIEVMPPSASQSGNPQPAAQQGERQAQSAAAMADDDILIRAFVDRSDVFKGQPVRATFKLYSRLPMSGIESAKYPAFNGFWTQELNTNPKPQREVYNNKIYDSQVLREYLLYPQQAGTLHIEQFDLGVVVQIVTRARRQSLFDDFFGGGSDIQEIRKTIKSAPVRITVRELPPGAPAGFNGTVGKFTMEANYPPDNIQTNSAANYTIKISGTGNLPLIQAPKLTFPTSFESYNIKTTESFSTTGGGISGYRQFEYPFIARAEGNYAVEPVEFSYFNPDLVQYVTLRSNPIEINVLPDSTGASSSSYGIVSGLSKEEIKILGEDIRFIKLGISGISPNNQTLMGSWLYFLLTGVMLGGFVFALLYLQKRIRESRNTALVRGKRANKVALQRLRTAEKYMKSEDRRGFYDEMLRAMWGYMSDKLNIPVANLTRENVREELLKRGVQPEQAQRFIDLISECEYAQYSPVTSGQMKEIYEGAIEVISRFESILKR